MADHLAAAPDLGLEQAAKDSPAEMRVLLPGADEFETVTLLRAQPRTEPEIQVVNEVVRWHRWSPPASGRRRSGNLCIVQTPDITELLYYLFSI